MTAVSCSLADDLQVDEVEVEDDTSPSACSPLRPDAPLTGQVVTSDSALPSDDAAPTVEDEQTVLHSNAPLAHYLGLHHIDPLHTVSVAAAPTEDGAADQDDEEEEDADVNANHSPANHSQHATATSPYERHLPLSSTPLLSLLTIFCPVLLSWTSLHPCNCSDQWAVRRCREQWHYTLQRCASHRSSRSSSSAADAGQRSPDGLFPLLRVALLAQSLLLSSLILIILSALLSASSVCWSTVDLLVAAVVSPVVLLTAAVNWMASYVSSLTLLTLRPHQQLRLSFAWHSSACLLLSYHSSFGSCNRLIQRAIQRITEVELVSKGYFLSPSPTPILIMDLKQAAHLRHSTQLRHTLYSTLHHLHSVMEEALMVDGRSPPVSSKRLAVGEALRVLWSCADVSSVFSIPLDSLSPLLNEQERQVKDVIPSLAELKWMKNELDTMQSALWSYLTTHGPSNSLDPCTLCRLLRPLQSVVQGVERRLKAALRFDPAAVPHTASAIVPHPSSPTSLSRVDHQLRSARARLHLASQRSLSSTNPLLTDLRYIQQVIHDVGATCREMEQQINQSAAPPTEEKEQPTQTLVNTTTNEEKQSTDDSDSDKSALMQEMQRLRRRRVEQPEGQGLVFEGEGQHHPHRAENDDSLPPTRFKPQSSSSPSPFALTLSMVTELKSVLSHRAPVPFHALSD